MFDSNDISAIIKKDIDQLKNYLGPENSTSKTGLSWWGLSHSGKPVSLFYDIQPENLRCGIVEFLDKRGVLKLSTDSFGIGYIKIEELSKFFIQHKY